MDHEEVGRLWNANADSWTQLARAGYDVYRDYLNTPAFFAMLPDVHGLVGLDIGCGEGHNTRLLAKRGARVTAVDIAAVFLAYAQQEEEREPLGIDYRLASAVALPFAEATFDFATGCMSFMDIPETERVLTEASRVLKPGGFLQFSLAHPCFDTPYRRNLRNAHGLTYAIEVGDYFRNLNGDIAEWLFGAAPPHVKHGMRQFTIPRFTRTVSQWLNLLVDTGFLLERVEEPCPSDATVRACPEYRKFKRPFPPSASPPACSPAARSRVPARASAVCPPCAAPLGSPRHGTGTIPRQARSPAAGGRRPAPPGLVTAAREIYPMENKKKRREVGSIGRRRFLATTAAGATLAVAPLVGKAVAGNSAPEPRALDPKAVEGKPWKLDVTIYDRPGWTCAFWGFVPFSKRDDNELVIGGSAQREDEIIDDFYAGHAEQVYLSSNNSGKSWEQITREDAGVDPDNPYPLRLPDGTLITVGTEVLTSQAQKERLEKLGLGHLWHPDSEFGWDLWPASYAEKLKEQGVAVYEQKGPALPPGTVATHNRPLVTNISHDGGRTWERRLIEGLPKFGHLAPARPAVPHVQLLPNGTVLYALYGQIIGKDKAGWGSASVYVLRSADRGQTWQLSSPIAYDPTGKHFFNETDLLSLPSGRILALVRCNSGKVHLYQSYSEDGGVSWSPPTPTPIPGAPGHLLRLKSGNILCT